MAEITISDLPAKTSLLDSDIIPIDDGVQTCRVTGAQLREFLKVNFLSVGTVVWSQSALATDNPGRLPLWTGEYIASASTIYPDFYSWVKNKHPELCKTKEQYDSALTQFGECPFYVVDEEEGSLRLPKLANYIKMANGIDGITQKEAGLPNITGSFSPNGVDGDTKATGAFALTSRSAYGAGHNSGTTYGFDFDASLSSEVYGKSETVTPAHTTLYPWVFAYNATVPASTAQAAEFQQGLSGKADRNLGNIPTNYDYVVESYQDETQWYRVYKSGWLEQGGIATEPYYSTVNQVTFLKPFKDTNYTLVVSGSRTGGYAESNMSVYDQAFNKTATGFQNYTHANQPKNWYACGQGETPVIDDTTSGSEDTTVGDDDEFNEW